MPRKPSSTGARRVRRDLEVPVGAVQFQPFAHETHCAGIGLEESQVGVTGDGELGFLEVGAQVSEVPGSGSTERK